MIEILQFIFSEWWICLGFIIILAVILDGIADIVRAARGINYNYCSGECCQKEEE